LVLIAAVATAARLATLWPISPLGADEVGYHALAEVLVTTGSYRTPEVYWYPLQGGKPGDPTAFRTPAFPVFLAGHYALLGPSDVYPRVTLIVLDVINCLLLIRLGARVLGSPPAGFVAGAAWAVWPPALVSGYGASSIMPETLGAFLLLGGVLTLARLLRRPSPVAAAGAGLLLGLAILTRGYIIVIVPLIALWIALLPSSRRARIGLLAGFAAGVGCLPGAWVVRNWAVLGQPILSTQTEHLYIGNNAWARGSMRGDVWEMGINAPQLKALERKYPGIWETSEFERSGIWLREGRNCVLQNLRSPGRLTWLHGRKAILFFSPLMDWQWGWYRYHYAYAAALLLACVGTQACLRGGKWRECLLLVSPFAAAFLVAQMAYAHDRMRYPAEPFVVFLGSYGLVAILKAVKTRGPESLPCPLPRP
jgi:4-amino-4-deoxy-L-arabinose transferase-like glycosyltransferase